MTNKKGRPTGPANLRQKAEALAREQSAGKPEDSAALSPEAIRKKLHELQVHQIELEMQNEELRTAQALIAAGRERYFDLYDLAPVGYCTLSDKGLILEANLTAATLLGTNRGALTKQPITRFIFKEDQDTDSLVRKKLFETGEPREYDLRLLKPDGAFFWAHLAATAAQADDGAPVCRVVISDITERKQADEALRKSEENLHITLRSIGDAVISGDIDRRCVFMNPVAESLTGWTENEAVGKPLAEIFRIINQQTRQTVESPVDNALRTGEIVGLANHTLLIARDGRETPIADSGAPIRNARGEISGVVLVFRDQTAEYAAQRVLEKSEARLRRAQKIAQVGDWEFNLKTGTVSASESANEIYGLPSHDLSIEDIQKVSLPEFRPLLDAAIRGLIREGKPYDVEFTIRRPSDQALVEIHSVAEYDPQTKIVFGVIQDISERKQAEEKLRANEAIKNKLVSNIGDVIVIIDQNGTNKYKSPNITRLFGWEPEELIGHNTWENVHPDDLKAGQTFFGTILAEPNATGTTELRYKRKDGHYAWIEISVINLLHDRDIQGILGNYHDITERKQEDAYREIRREVLQVLNETGDPQDALPRVVAVLKTRTGVDAVGLRLQKGDDFPYFVQDGFPADFLQTENTLLERGKDCGVCRDKDGKVRLECTCGLVISGQTDPSSPLFTKGGSSWMNDSFPLLDLPSDQDPRLQPRNNCIHQGYASVALIPVRTSDRVVGLLQLNDKRKNRFTLEMIEILEGIAAHIGMALMRKRAEAEQEKLQSQLNQAQKMEAIGTMAGGIAHDFNNLLAIVSSNIEAIQIKLQKKIPLEKNVENILTASTRAKNLVSQILAFSRQEKAEVKPIDLSATIEESLKLLRSTIPKTIEIMNVLENRPIFIDADSTLIQQVLFNICNNANHAMNGKGLLKIALNDVDISTRDLPVSSKLPAGIYAKLSISDTGSGIDKQTITRIFDPFFTTKDVGIGTGMGLSVVHGIVEQHGGFITVDSAPGQGTTFDVYFPLSTQLYTKLKTSKTGPVLTGTERILFVDDEECIAYTCNELLECQGYKVTSVTSGREALDLFKANPASFDLVITDQTMPVMSGAELATELLKIRPDIPIILCSGYSAMVSEAEAKGIGIREFCMKPMDMKQLATVARNVLDARGVATSAE